MCGLLVAVDVMTDCYREGLVHVRGGGRQGSDERSMGGERHRRIQQERRHHASTNQRSGQRTVWASSAAHVNLCTDVHKWLDTGVVGHVLFVLVCSGNTGALSLQHDQRGLQDSGGGHCLQT